MKALPGYRSQGNDIIFAMSEGDGTADLALAASIAKTLAGRCREIYIKKPTLDDVFLNLTGTTLAEKVS